MIVEEKKKVFSSFFYPVVLIILLWGIKLFELEYSVRLVEYGLFPRSISGLKGILLSPLIHSDTKHLFNNSVPLLFMGASLFFFYRKVAFRVVSMIVLVGGFWTWISAREAFHIGASGLVYGLFGFLLVSGFVRRHKALMSISFLVAFIYGSLVWGILPIDYKISWEGHLWGLLAGMAMAFYYRREGPQREVYQWEEEDDDEEDDEDAAWKQSQEDQKVTVQYHFRHQRSDENNKEP